MKAMHIQPGMVINHDLGPAIVYSVSTNVYNEDIGYLTAISCELETSGYEIDLLLEPSEEVLIIAN